MSSRTQRKYTGKTNINISGLEKLRNPQGSRFESRLWMASVLVWTIVCSYQIGHCCDQYLYGQPSIRVDMEKKQILPLPTAVVCPNKLFEKKNPLVKQYRKRYKELFPEKDTENMYFSDLLDLPNITMDDLWDLHRLNTNTTTCRMLCSTFKNDTSCIENLIVEAIPTASGSCMVINTNGWITTHGPVTRFEVHIDTSWLPHFSVDDFAKIHIVDEGMNVKYMDYDEGVPVPSQATAMIGAKLMQKINVNYYKNPCASNEEIIKCKSKCVEDYLYANAPCRLPFMKPVLNDCSTSEMFNKSIEVSLIATRKGARSCKCPRKCHDDIYVLFGDIVEMKITDHGTLNATCFYLDSYVQVMREFYSYDSHDLLTDIGTYLGFFLGLCFLNFCEIGEWMLQKWMTAFHNRKSKNVIGPKQRKILPQSTGPKLNKPTGSSVTVSMVFVEDKLSLKTVKMKQNPTNRTGTYTLIYRNF